MLSYARFVSDEQRDLIVRNAAQLLEIHLRLQAKLQRVEEDLGWVRDQEQDDEVQLPSPSKQYASSNATVADAACRVCDIFLDEAHNLLEAYRPFCSDQTEAMETIKAISVSRLDWDSFEAQCTNQLALRKSGSSRLQFADFLIKPVQRVCKYPLLFGNILKYAPEGQDQTCTHRITEAFEEIKRVAEGVDEAQKQRILEITAVKLALRMDVHDVRVYVSIFCFTFLFASHSYVFPVMSARSPATLIYSTNWSKSCSSARHTSFTPMHQVSLLLHPLQPSRPVSLA